MVFYRTTIVIVLIALFLSTEAKTYARLSCYTPINSYNAQLAKADSFKSYLDFELADQIYLDLLKRSDQEDILCYASLSRADNYLRHKKTKEAIDIIDNVELNTLCNSSSSVLDITYLQAQIMYQLGQYDSALVLYKTVDQFFKRNNYDPLYRGEFLNNFGELYLYGFEDIPRAKKCIDEALNIWQNQSDDSHFILGRIYYNLANIYGRRTEAAIQVNYVEKAMSIAKLYNKKYPRLQFVCYSLFAESSAINQKPKEAIEWIKKQIIYAEKNKINTDLLMYSYNDLAEYYFRDENFLSSLKYNNYIINNFESSALQSSLVYS
ncbi:MAG: tetratricopeptide repeat protein, partial [Ignavibacteriae bacterium]|nr:tetratricopeptide repeat protein [Ignavibacteriota bacterium]